MLQRSVLLAAFCIFAAQCVPTVPEGGIMQAFIPEIEIDTPVIALEGLVRVRAIQDIFLQTPPALKAKDQIVLAMFGTANDNDCKLSPSRDPTVSRLNADELAVNVADVVFSCSLPAPAEVHINLDFTVQEGSFGNFEGHVSNASVIQAPATASAISTDALNAALKLENIHLDVSMLSTSVFGTVKQTLSSEESLFHLPTNALVDTAMKDSYKSENWLKSGNSRYTEARFLKALKTNYEATDDGYALWMAGAEAQCAAWCAVKSGSAHTISTFGNDACTWGAETTPAEKTNYAVGCTCSDADARNFGNSCPSGSASAWNLSGWLFGSLLVAWSVMRQ